VLRVVHEILCEKALLCKVVVMHSYAQTEFLL